MGKGNDFYKLERSIQDEVKDSPEGKLIAEDQREANLRGSETRAQRQKLTDAAREEVQTAVEIYRKEPAGTVSKIAAAEDLRALVSKVQAKSAAQRDVMLSDFKPVPNPITDGYYAALKAGNVPGVAKTDRTPVDDWLATQGKNPVEGGEPGDTWADYVGRNTGLSFNNIPEIKELHEAQKAIAKSGWWELRNKANQWWVDEYGPGANVTVKNNTDFQRALNKQAEANYPDDLAGQVKYKNKEFNRINKYNKPFIEEFLAKPGNENIPALLVRWGYSDSAAVLQELP